MQVMEVGERGRGKERERERERERGREREKERERERETFPPHLSWAAGLFSTILYCISHRRINDIIHDKGIPLC